MQQVSDYELELLKIIWADNDNQAVYAEIVEALEKKVFISMKISVSVSLWIQDLCQMRET